MMACTRATALERRREKDESGKTCGEGAALTRTATTTTTCTHSQTYHEHQYAFMGKLKAR